MTSKDGSEKPNPLEDLYVDTDEINRERIRDALTDLIGIDQETGDPLFYDGFAELTTKQKFAGLLLYRRALLLLNNIEEKELGKGSSYFAELIDVDDSTIRHAANDAEYTENRNERGGYYIPTHRIDIAIQLPQQSDEE